MAAEKATDWFDKKVFGTMVVVLIIVAIIIWYLNRNNKPAGGLTQAEYDALSATDKAAYQLDPKGSGYYVKKG